MHKLLLISCQLNIIFRHGLLTDGGHLHHFLFINFLWLPAGQKAPDYSTIARFRTGHLLYACEDLLYQMVRRPADMGELSKETIFIDRTILETCANKYTFIGKWKKIFSKIEEAIVRNILQNIKR